MNNGRARRERARLHNLAVDEREAYKQDRLEQPEKYEEFRRILASRNASKQSDMLVLMAAMSSGVGYL